MPVGDREKKNNKQKAEKILESHPDSDKVGCINVHANTSGCFHLDQPLYLIRLAFMRHHLIISIGLYLWPTLIYPIRVFTIWRHLTCCAYNSQVFSQLQDVNKGDFRTWWLHIKKEPAILEKLRWDWKSSSRRRFVQWRDYFFELNFHKRREQTTSSRFYKFKFQY